MSESQALTCCLLLQNEAASCSSVNNCTFANALYTNGANPHTITGAVVEFATFSDSYKVWPLAACAGLGFDAVLLASRQSWLHCRLVCRSSICFSNPGGHLQPAAKTPACKADLRAPCRT